MSIDDALIKGVQKITNYRLKKDYPLMDDNHYSESDVKMILESLAMILEEYDFQRRPQSIDKQPKNKRSKSVREVPKK